MSEYTKQAKDFLKKCGAKMSITYKDTVYNPWGMESRYAGCHKRYTVRIDRNHKSFTFCFTDSIYNTQNGKRPTCYDVLACLTKYEVGTYHDFCADFGYKPYDYDMFDCVRVNGEYYNRKSWKTYNAVKREYNKVARIFGDVLEELAEIN